MNNNTNQPKKDENNNEETANNLGGFGEKTGPAAFKENIKNEQCEDNSQNGSTEKKSIELERALDKIRRLEEELADVKDKMLREAAEVENIRRRSQKDREDAKKFSIASFAKDLLDVNDNFSRALDAAPKNRDELDDHIKSLLEGIEATQRAMIRAFERNGIKEISPIDEKFDPNLHEVMFEVPTPDKEDGTIIQILETGYTLNDRLLRPARVGVSKNSDKPDGEHVVNQKV